jgi:hypothetical protein
MGIRIGQWGNAGGSCLTTFSPRSDVISSDRVAVNDGLQEFGSGRG